MPDKGFSVNGTTGAGKSTSLGLARSTLEYGLASGLHASHKHIRKEKLTPNPSDNRHI